MPNDSFTMAKFGPAYRNAPRVDFGPQVERTLDNGRTKERWWRAQYLKLDRAILRLQIVRESNKEAAPKGQLSFDFKDAA